VPGLTWFLYYAGFYFMQIVVALFTIGSFRWETLLLATASFPIYTKAFLNALLRRDQAWSVTGQRGVRNSPFTFIVPQVLVFTFLLATSVVGVWQAQLDRVFSLAVFWNILNTLVIGAFVVTALRESREIGRESRELRRLRREGREPPGEHDEKVATPVLPDPRGERSAVPVAPVRRVARPKVPAPVPAPPLAGPPVPMPPLRGTGPQPGLPVRGTGPQPGLPLRGTGPQPGLPVHGGPALRPVSGVPAARAGQHPVPNSPGPNSPVPNSPVPNSPVPNSPVPNSPVTQARPAAEEAPRPAERPRRRHRLEVRPADPETGPMVALSAFRIPQQRRRDRSDRRRRGADLAADVLAFGDGAPTQRRPR
jgi:cellulose synthase (UDP-forming)